MKGVAGVDIGSLTAKTVILNAEGEQLASSVVPEGVVNEEAAQNSMRQALARARLSRRDLGYVVTTGYGRTLVKFGDKDVTEISCHARGAHALYPGVRTVIDIGGQDSKAISLDAHGRVVKFNMNDKCAAGTGRFLEVMARAMGVAVEEMGALSLKSREPARVSSLCTVFAESEIISLATQGCARVDIIAGIHEAIGRRMLSLVNGVGVRPQVMMSGGVAMNKAVVQVLSRLLGAGILVPAEPQTVGALGAAMFALEEVKAGVQPEEVSN